LPFLFLSIIIVIMSEINDKFVIEGLGGKRILSGEILVGGAKNAALKVLASTILFRDGFEISNTPEIEDVFRMFDLLTDLGIAVEKKNHGFYKLNSKTVFNKPLQSEIAKRMRSSIVLTGPLLARFGEVSFPYPGGCVIGKRPVDLFLSGFKKMGATVTEKERTFTVKTSEKGLLGTEIFFKNQSVTATETFLMTAILAKGRTILKNCALEPEIVSLGEFLNKCGAKISGLGTPTIKIEGGELLIGIDRKYETIPDRIEAGSFIILGALAANDLKVVGCQPKHLEALINLLQESGVVIEIGEDFVRVKGCDKKYQAVDVKTHEYPGFPTDLQAPMAIFLSQAVGESFIFETIFEGRLNYLEALSRMGLEAKNLDTHRAIIYGQRLLEGKEIESPDLRAGLAYVLAAIIALGQSTVHNVKYIDRGYEKIEERFQQIGVKIKRIK
jgi:UDP-N-acetylglucosamine 1-carboxyvinyltransferase